MEAQAAVIPVVLALASSVAFLAIRFPDLYEDVLHYKFLAACLVLIALAALWDASNFLAFDAARSFVIPEKINEARTAADLRAVPYGYLYGVGFIVPVYFGVLAWLAGLIRRRNNGVT